MTVRMGDKYVENGSLTQAGYSALRGTETAVDALTTRVATAETDITALEAVAITAAPGPAPLYACRAWVNFNGTGTVAIRASGNVSSITDNGTGDYTINFTTAMPDAYYVVVATGGAASGGGAVRVADGVTLAAGSVRIQCVNNTGTATIDFDDVCVAIFR